MQAHLLLFTQIGPSSISRNRFQAGVRAMTQTSTITKEGSNKENSPNRTSLNWQILAWPPPGL